MAHSFHGLQTPLQLVWGEGEISWQKAMAKKSCLPHGIQEQRRKEPDNKRLRTRIDPEAMPSFSFPIRRPYSPLSSPPNCAIKLPSCQWTTLLIKLEASLSDTSQMPIINQPFNTEPFWEL